MTCWEAWTDLHCAPLPPVVVVVVGLLCRVGGERPTAPLLVMVMALVALVALVVAEEPVEEEGEEQQDQLVAEAVVCAASPPHR